MNPPSPPDVTATAHRFTTIRAYLGPEGGGPPDFEADEPPATAEVVRLVHAVGLGSLCELEMPPKVIRDRDANVPRQEAHVWLIDREGERGRPLFWGEILSSRLQIRSGDQVERRMAVVSAWHCGEVLKGEVVWDPEEEEERTVHGDVRFNPSIDGVIRENRSDVIPARGDDPDDPPHFIWVDPESVRTPEAQAYQDQVPAKWVLPRAVETLQAVLNEDETYVKNPDLFDGQNIRFEKPFEGAPELENVRLRRGLRLPEIFDQLLPPHGIGWFLSFAAAEDEQGEEREGIVEPTFAYYERGKGTEKFVRLQKENTPLDPTRTDLERASVLFDLADLVTKVTAHGSLERELTIPLYRAWHPEQDAIDVPDLDRDDAESMYAQNTAVKRKWVANEANDYDELREEIERPALEEVFDDEYVAKRRRIHEPLTYRAQAEREEGGLRRPVFVEWRDRDDEEAEWQAVPWPFAVLENEIGIIFNGQFPPAELYDIENPELRITGTLFGDKALEGEAARDSTSPLDEDIELFLDLTDRFHDRQRVTEGDFASVLTGEHDQRDDQEAIDEYCEKVRDIECAAVTQARLQLFGLRFGYELGDVITKIEGRNISFARTAGGDQYLQVIGIEWDVLGQTTALRVAPYDAEVL